MFDRTNLKNMLQLLQALRDKSENRLLLKYMDGLQVLEMRSDDFFQKVDICTQHLLNHGLSGTHIGIMGANRPEWMIHLCAVFLINAVPVLLAPDLNSEDLTDRIIQTNIHCVLYDAALEPTVLPAISATNRSCICMDTPIQTDASHNTPLPCQVPSPDDLACILFTSGSTAESKAVMLSHKAMIAGICHNVIALPFTAQLAILPMHHLAGFATVLNTWYLGRLICLGTEYKYLFRYLEHMKPDYTSVVPSMLQPILRKLRKGGPNGHNLGWDLHYIGCGGAQFPPDAVKPLNENNIRIFQGYGATEMGSIGFIREMTPEEHTGCIGYPPDGMEIAIRNNELMVQSDSLMMGYYGDPAATAQVLTDGWYHTGDLARFDTQGAICLTGRRKNVIILSNGENVSPEEIETKLLRFPSIEEILVGAESDRIAAWVYAEDSACEQVRLDIDAYNCSAPTYKQVHTIHFLREPIPKNSAGKPLRHTIIGGDYR